MYCTPIVPLKKIENLQMAVSRIGDMCMTI